MSNLLHITALAEEAGGPEEGLGRPEGGWRVLRKGWVGLDLVEESGRRVKSTVAGVSWHTGEIS